jgi:hypothetical protein
MDATMTWSIASHRRLLKWGLEAAYHFGALAETDKSETLDWTTP